MIVKKRVKAPVSKDGRSPFWIKGLDSAPERRGMTERWRFFNPIS